MITGFSFLWNQTQNFALQSNMVLLQIGGLAACFLFNIAISSTAHNWKEDKEFFTPPASIIFTFYPLIISLPEAHYKLINYSIDKNSEKEFDEDELFPYAFLISLLSITVSMIIDKFWLGQEQHSHEQQQDKDHNHESESWSKVKNPLVFLLTLSIALQNVVNFYFICVEPNQKQLAKEILLFMAFNLLINFAHSYLLAQTGITSQTNLKLSVFMNSGMIVGYLLSLVIEPDMTLLILPCFCAGLQIYCSIFMCFPHIFSNGEKIKEDKSRFLAIVIAFLATVIYYPLCYILRI